MRRRLHELAKDRPSFGAKRLHVMLRRDGLVINHKKAHRLYVEEGLQLKPRRRRRRSATVRQPRALVTRSGRSRTSAGRWTSVQRMHDMLATGQTVRVFTLVDVFTRECIALEVARSFSGSDVARMLSDAGERMGGLPPIVQCDNGTEFVELPRRRRSITGPTGIACNSTSAARANRSTTASAKRSTGA